MQDDIDLEILVEGFKYALKTADTAPLKDLIEARVNPPPSMELSTDAQIRGAHCFLPFVVAGLGVMYVSLEFVSGFIVTTWRTRLHVPFIFARTDKGS